MRQAHIFKALTGLAISALLAVKLLADASLNDDLLLQLGRFAFTMRDAGLLLLATALVMTFREAMAALGLLHVRWGRASEPED